jgi:ABC-type molybdate transport system substrate-binding protein
VYPAAVMKNTAAGDEAKRFMDFLLGDPAARIFERFGFAMARQAR